MAREFTYIREMQCILTSLFGCFLMGVLPCMGQTMGLTHYEPNEYSGYMLLSPVASFDSYLINTCGESVHTWQSAYKAGLSSVLAEDGVLWRAGNVQSEWATGGGAGGIIQAINWQNDVMYEAYLSSDSLCQHHDFCRLPNGHLLVLLWERHSIEEAVNVGKQPNDALTEWWSERIVEIEPIGTNDYVIVWQWRLWDHLIQDYDMNVLNFGAINDHPELVDVNYTSGPMANPDWIHLNSIDFDPLNDRILLSAHNLNEVWIIDHSTTTAEAVGHMGGNAGRGGDLIYRWGNPQAYQRGTPNDKKLYGQHHATFVPNGFPNEGQIFVFNNGVNRPDGDYSSVERWEANFDFPTEGTFGPSDPAYVYTADPAMDFYSANISGVFPLQNGDLLITEGSSGRSFLVDEAGLTRWEFINPINATGAQTQGQTPTGNAVFRCAHYTTDFSGILNLSNPEILELNPLVPSLCAADFVNPINMQQVSQVLLVSDQLKILTPHYWRIYNSIGQCMVEGSGSDQVTWRLWPVGCYFFVSRKERISFVKTH
jgi:Arylsulfotransferase (ASST)